MIKLIINSESGSFSYNFTKKVLTLGSGSPSEIDVPLKEPGLLPVHIKINEEDGFFIITNCANDPFINLNGTAFGKKILKTGDVLQIGKTVISFDITPFTIPSTFSQPLSKKEDFTPVDIEKELKGLEYQVDEASLGQELDIAALMDEVKQFNEPDEFESSKVTKKDKKEIIAQKTVKNDLSPRILSNISHEIEDESPGQKKEKVVEKKYTPQKIHTVKTNNWRLLLTVVFSVITLLAICGAWIFINLNDKTLEEEILAAQGISDIAMALTYSQINHISPQMQNWSDPKFLKENFATLIPSNSSFLANVDSHSHFINCPYILRIYSNKDISRFLVIALPAPSLSQWLIPKNAILVDSQAMELRKIQDLRALNRLLVNPNTLENQNGMEISALVKQGVLLPLEVLSKDQNNPEFAPPKALASIRPGAENYLYNAPRYYSFGEAFALRAINLTKASEKASHELKRLQEEVLEIAKLPHLVLYSSGGIEGVSQAKKAMKTFVPQAKFLNAYIIPDEEGGIVSSHLFLQDELFSPEDVGLIKPHSLHPQLTFLSIKNPPLSKQVNENHPLKFQLLALSSARKQVLEPLVNEMTLLLNRHITEYDEDFSAKFSALLKQYETLDQKEQQKIAEEIHNLYDTYASMPLTEVLPYTKAAGLEQIAQASLKMKKDNPTGERFDYLLLGIENASDLTELSDAVSNAATFIRIKNIPETTTLITYQKRIRLEVTKKLDGLLLSPEVPLPPEELSSEKRKLLVKILEQSWIADSDEQQFYLSEFDALVNDDN